MLRLLVRLVGAVLALAGLVLAAVGAWFLSSIGTDGTATFSAGPNASRAVVVPPSVLNRMDTPTVVRASAGDGGKVWIGVAAPSDATALLGTSPRFEVGGVSVGDWSVQTRPVGSGEVGDLEAQDLWRSRTEPAAEAELRIDQADAPETVVIVPAEGTVRTVTLEWTKGDWGSAALTVLMVGIAAALIGLGMLLGSILRGRRGSHEQGADRDDDSARQPAVVGPPPDSGAAATETPAGAAAEGSGGPGAAPTAPPPVPDDDADTVQLRRVEATTDPQPTTDRPESLR